MYTKLKTFLKGLFRPYQYYQVLLVVRDCGINEVAGFEFRIDQSPTQEQMERLSRISWRQCGGVTSWFTTFELVHNGRSKDSKVGSMPKVASSLLEELGACTDIHPITSINIID